MLDRRAARLLCCPPPDDCRPLLLCASPLHPPAGANSDISLADLRGQARAAAAKNAHPLAVSPDTWQEVGAGRLCV